MLLGRVSVHTHAVEEVGVVRHAQLLASADHAGNHIVNGHQGAPACSQQRSTVTESRRSHRVAAQSQPSRMLQHSVTDSRFLKMPVTTSASCAVIMSSVAMLPWWSARLSALQL